MPKFEFNKLIRNNLRSEYEKMGQKATYRKLSKEEFSEALKQKLLEEACEIDTKDRQSVVNELADVYQVIEDMMDLNGVSLEEVVKVKDTKFQKKGGFSEAAYVEILELDTDDEWNEYYRKQPDVFKELS